VCIFYLVLRALDTVEDDMAIPDNIKCPELEAFYKKIYDPTFSHTCGEKHYKRLMEEYPKVTDVFLKLKKPYRDVIEDITKRMGAGMSSFITREVVSLKDWDEYCHYVAGLVGIGLSNLWAGSLLEDARFAEEETLANSMGLFLQKTNIIRDYLEDITEVPRPRMFWPKCVWSKYGDSLDAFKEPENREAALHCMNHLISNALEHGVDALEYLAKLKNVDVFRFCAIPQVMAVATLAECYGNGKVFEGVVKIRRGLSARIMLETLDIYDVAKAFKEFGAVIAGKAAAGVDAGDPTAKTTLRNLHKIEQRCDVFVAAAPPGFMNKHDVELPVTIRMFIWCLMAGYVAHSFQLGNVRQTLGLAPATTGNPLLDNLEKLASLFFIACASIFLVTGKMLS